MLRLAIVGRPNVGKSTLFNALVGKHLALVHDAPGVTRDWREAEAVLFGDRFIVIDTAGLEDALAGTVTAAMRAGTLAALEASDVALFLIDARAGVTAADQDLAALLRKAKKPVLLGAAKAENPRAAAAALAEAHALGLGASIPLSAAHSLGFDDLHGALVPYLREGEPPPVPPLPEDGEALGDLDALEGLADYAFPEAPERPIKLAIVGRPNVGKSTLLNALIGQARALTGPEAGVTRDAVEVRWAHAGREWRLVDTAGLRKRARVTGALEKMAGAEALRAVRLAQMVALVVDATAPVERQDVTLAGHVLEEGRALILVLNKWDAVADREGTLAAAKEALQRAMGQAGAVPIVTLSALTGRRVPALMDAAAALYDRWNARAGTGALNRWLAVQTSRHPPPLSAGRPNKIKYMTQVKARPPTFVAWASRPGDIPDSYRRYLAAGLQRDFGMEGTPVRLDIRASKNPYA